MDDAIFALLQKGIVSPHEAFMNAIDKNRFKLYLPAEEAALGNAAGSVPDDEQKLPGNFVKQQRRACSCRANPSSNPQRTKGNSFVTENPYSPTADSFTLGVIHRKNKANLKQER